MSLKTPGKTRRRTVLARLRTAAAFALLAAGAAGAASSCDSTIEVANSAPRVTWIAVAPPVDGVAEITVWISDIEGDAVDLALAWRPAGDGSTGTPVTLAAGGHGVVGLTTHLETFDPNGQAHLIRWDLTGVSGSVELRMQPSDGEDTGVAALSPAFDVSVGLPDAVEVIAQ